MEFSIASYNLALSVGPPFVFNGAHARAERVADAFYANVGKQVDVIFLQELVVHRDKVLHSFIYHPYHTYKVCSNLFSNNVRFLSSGLAVVSKWPIVTQRSHVFTGTTYHMEKFMSKSVLYAKISTPAGFVHVFNSHVNAWSTPRAVTARENQAQQIGAFIESLSIPSNEYVWLGGDLNLDIYEHVDLVDHISQLAGGFTFHKPQDVVFSSDPLLNTLVGTDDAAEYTSRSMVNGCYDDFMRTGQCLCCPRQLIDLIGTSTSHKQPSQTHFEVIVVKSRAPFAVHLNVANIRRITDVSDHFPVVLHMQLEQQQQQQHITATTAASNEKQPMDYQPPTELSYGWLFVTLLFTLAYSVILTTVVMILSKLCTRTKQMILMW